MKVTAVAERSGDWWAISVPQVEGVFTQARRLEQVPTMVADAVALMLDLDEPVEVEVQPRTNETLSAAGVAARERIGRK